MRGFISYWNDDKGYGFITEATTGRQYFFHHSNFPHDHRPIIRYRVTFEVAPGKNGKRDQATNVRLVDMTPQSSTVIAGVEEALNGGSQQ